MLKSCLFSVMCSFVISMQSLFALDQEVMSRLFPDHVTKEMEYVTVQNPGQLGNHCFRVSVGLVYALKTNCYFSINSVAKNRYPEIFYKFPSIPINRKWTNEVWPTPDFKGHLEIKGSTMIYGFPHSTKYMKGYKDIIRSFFKPKPSTEKKLREKFKYVFDSPKKYVGLHLRTFVIKEDPHVFSTHKWFFPRWAISPLYYEKAIDYFDDDVTFIVSTDYIPAAKEMLAMYDRKFIFTENSLEEDFYLISMMDNMIINNSTFSNFAAFLNPSPDKQVVRPKYSTIVDMDDEKWICIENDINMKNIGKEYDEWYEICKKHARYQGFIK